MARYLDADSLLEQISKKKCEVGKIRYLDGFNDGLMRVRSIISAAPTADVQEIVRCKDCKHTTFYSCKNDACYKGILCDYEIPTDDENFYCAYGERRK